MSKKYWAAHTCTLLAWTEKLDCALFVESLEEGESEIID
jgi:hypothetical protein